MHDRLHLTSFALLLALASPALAACGDSGNTTTNGGTESTSPTSSTGTTAGPSAATDTASTTEPGGSEGATGSTGPEPTTTTTTGATEGTSTSVGTTDAPTTDVDPTTSTTDATTGGGVTPGNYDPCPPPEEAALCPETDTACVNIDGPGGFGPDGSFFVYWTFCTRECDVDEDCVSGLDGGTAVARCLPYGPNQINICVLDCGFGKTCPEGLACSYADFCGHHECDCSGDLCNDPLCMP